DPRKLVDSMYPAGRFNFCVARASLDVYEALLALLQEMSALSPKDRKRFRLAIDANLMAHAVDNSAPVLGVIARFAALGALAEPLLERCPGQVSCTVCGPLPALQP